MSSHYLTCGNIYIVPVLRNRLSFAVLVRKALHELSAELEWGPEDLIAVSLPPSMKESLYDAISNLPQVSLVMAGVRGERTKEVFAVTPCDAMIEGVRVAQEKDWPLQLIDLDVSPRNLIKTCAQDPDWPDDSLVHMLGVERYLSMIEGYFSQPPARREPTDSWREEVIASNLQHQQPLFRRILVICDASMAQPVMAKLQEPPCFTGLDLGLDEFPIKYKVVQQLRLEVLLTYLDDYPKLVQEYEQERMYSAHTFDKFDRLIRSVLTSSTRAKDLNFSTRQHQAFNSFLNNLLHFDHRVCPSPDVLYGAASGCLSKAFAERLHCYLSGYYSQITVHRVERNDLARKDVYKYSIEVNPKREVHVSRTCNPLPPRYNVIPPFKKPTNKSDLDNSVVHFWPAEFEFLLRMHTKLARVAVDVQRTQKVMEYRGSIEMGVDVRRTLRSAMGGSCKFYVKAYQKRTIRVSTHHEPVAWVLSEDIENSGGFGSEPIDSVLKIKARDYKPQPGVEFWIQRLKASWDSSDPDSLSNHYSILNQSDDDYYSRFDPKGKVLHGKYCGYVTFGYEYETKKEFEKAYGDEISRRVPNHIDFEHPRGCVHKELVPLAENGATWLELLLLTAVKYAHKTAVVVAPSSMTIPSSVLQHPFMKGKTLTLIPLERFTRSEREKLPSEYLYIADENNPKAIDDFITIMRPFWED